MNIKNTQELFNSIRKDSLKLIKEKNVDLDMLAFECDISTRKLIELLNKKDNDLLIYLKIYNTLVEWQVCYDFRRTN